MSLYFHIGSSGSGKSTAIYNKIIREAAREKGQTFLFVVPEQFTLRTQRELIALSPVHGIMNIDVLSFPRMAYRVLEDLGRKQPVVLEDTGKSMIVKKVVLDKKDELGIYAGKIHKQGFIDEMKSVIAEFYQYSIGDDRLDTMEKLAGDNSQLRSKLHDIRTVYDGFRDFISGRYIMNEEVLDMLCEYASESKVLKDAVICFDGFTGFTTSQLRVLRSIMGLAKEIHITLTMDCAELEKKQDEESLFFLSSKTCEKVGQIASECGVAVKIVKYGEQYRLKNRAGLMALEKNIFRYPPVRGLNRDGIRIVSCENPIAEIRFAISEIKRLVSERGLHYKDIAVVSGAMDSYGGIADREFAKSGMPYFVDRKKNIIGTAPVEMLRALIETAQSDFSYAAVFRLLKTGLGPLDTDECMQLENYCIANGIRGKSMWSKEWTRQSRTRYTQNLEEINRYRGQVYSVLAPAVEVLSSKKVTVSGRIAALNTFLEKCNTEALLAKEAEEKSQSADSTVRNEGKESGRLFETIMNVFVRIDTLLGRDEISLKEFREILETGFREAKLAMLPQGADSILIGDIERSRLENIKVLFFLGVNDGIIPAQGSKGGLLSDADRNIFADNDIELSPTKKQSTYLSEFYLYLNMTKPSEELIISSYRMGIDKTVGRPSYIVAKLVSMFDGLTVEQITDTMPGMAVGTDLGLHTVAGAVRDKVPGELTPEEKTLIRLLKERDLTMYERLCAAACPSEGKGTISPENARTLYNNVLTGSVSRLEKYATCAFSHFLCYGLKLEEREEYGIGNLELGNIYHKALELYCKGLKEAGIRWHDTTPKIREEYRIKGLEEALTEYEGVFASSKRNEYIKTKVSRILGKTVEILTDQVNRGDMEPSYFEESFCHSSEYMRLRGTIDRMDICEKNGKRYVRIVDYKSGSKTFDLTKLYYGLQIQLGVYLKEGREILSGKDKEGLKGEGPAGGSERDEKDGPAAGIPASETAGLYYYSIDDPIVEIKRSDISKEEVSFDSRFNGPSNEAKEILGVQDKELTDEKGEMVPGYSSKVINVSTVKSGSLSANSKVYSAEQFDKICDYLDKTMNERGREIMEGNIEINPYEMGSEKSCNYCPYSGVCGFDTHLGDKYRTIKKGKEEEIWQKIDGAMNS